MKKNLRKDYKYEERRKFKKIFGFEAPVGIESLALKKFKIDIIKLDSMILDYNGDECTYKGKEKYSLNMAIKEKYGEEATDIVDSLI